MKEHLTIAVVGYGSIGKRHIRNICSIFEEKGQRYTLDVYRHSVNCEEIANEDKNKIANSYQIDDVEKNNIVYDVVFITNPTINHYDTINRFLPYARNMFIEKPLFANSGYDIDALLSRMNMNGTYYVACPLRYTAVFEYIKQYIDPSKVYSVRVICSSYLPEWRQNIDYRKTYSAHRSMGGGVGIDLIHEWDYICNLFGIPQKVLFAGGKFSDLELNSEDLATYIGVYKDKLVEVHLDYFGRSPVRELMLFTKEETIVADFNENCIRGLKSNQEIIFSEQRDDFQKKELEHFFDIVDGKCPNDSTVMDAYNTLLVALGEK